MGKLPRRDAIEKLFAKLAHAPSNIASLTIGADGTVAATFFPSYPGIEQPAPAAVKTIPGTIFPDDDSPINAADLVLNPISLDDDAN